MPTYIYEAMNSVGQPTKGEVDAASSEEAIAKVRAMGSFPTKIKEKTGAPFAMHEAESAGMIASGMARVMGLFMSGSGESLPKPDMPLNDGDTIGVGDLSFTVLHTPGHSPGGISLYGHGVVFVGDTLFNLSIGRTDFPGCSHQQLIDSINSKLMTLPDNTVVYPGHGPQTTIRTERQYNPFLVS